MLSAILWPATVRAPHAMVASADGLANQAGMAVLQAGGNAVAAALATNAVLAVTAPHLCGMGGDLFALVHAPGMDRPAALNASGRAGSGADAGALRAEGRRAMPFKLDARSITVPGCVDGWIALHARFGSRPLADLLRPAIGYATDGFPCSPLLAASAAALPAVAGSADITGAGRLRSGQRLTRPGVAATLTAIATGGRDSFYLGPFGAGFRRLAGGLFDEADLARSQADWVDALGLDAWGARLWTTPPNSQGYLILASSWIASGLPLPTGTDGPDDPAWAHLLVEAARQASFDRPHVLHDGAGGAALVSAARRLRASAASADASLVAAVPSTFFATASCT